MADLAYRTTARFDTARRTNWGAIWIGLFAFISIWTTFGTLGEAIFASAANPNAAAPVAGMNVGESAWIIILTIISMYVAGRVTTHFAQVADRAGRMMYGLATFGLSVTAFILVAIMVGAAVAGGSGVNGSVHSSYLLGAFADIGWVAFVSLVTGWFAAMAGAAQGPLGARAVTESNETGDVENIRRAA